MAGEYRDDPIMIPVTDVTKIPEQVVPALQAMIPAFCKTEAQKKKAQALLDARDQRFNEYINTLDDSDDDELSDEEEDDLLRELGYE